MEAAGCEQQQALILEVSHHLRRFFQLFPSVSAEQSLSLCPEFNPPQDGKWTLQQIYLVRASLITALNCVFEMFSAVEDRWLAKYTEMEQGWQAKHRLWPCQFSG